MAKNSCGINNKENNCSKTPEKNINLKKHWNEIYTNTTENKLGWYENDLSPTLKLLFATNLSSDARILNVGVGSSTLIDELIKLGYQNLIASDISNIALENLKNRNKSSNIEVFTDDLSKPNKLEKLANVDLWIDRAVLHFLSKDEEQDIYFKLLKSKININGYVILAEYNLNGASKCAGLPIKKYSKEILIEKLGIDFELIDSFDYIFKMPSGEERPYIYTLFKKR